MAIPARESPLRRSLPASQAYHNANAHKYYTRSCAYIFIRALVSFHHVGVRFIIDPYRSPLLSLRLLSFDAFFYPRLFTGQYERNKLFV